MNFKILYNLINQVNWASYFDGDAVHPLAVDA